MENSWYLAVDMQFYIIAPTLIYCISRWRRVGLGVLVMLILSSCIHAGTAAYINQATPVL